MPFGEDDDRTTYVVVMNNEEQYSIWPKHKLIPAGWRAVEMEGPKAECLRYIDEVWKDMRPLSLRRKMEADLRGSSGE
jgi:MbtH protein